MPNEGLCHSDGHKGFGKSRLKAYMIAVVFAKV